MNNFDYYCPTRVLFGKGKISELPNLINKSDKILLIYGGGSIKQNGVYEQVTTALSGYQLYEFGGIEPNPKYETLMKAVKCIKDNDIDFLLSVGGGSTLDGTKFIAAAAKHTGDDAYDDIVIKGLPVKDALPFGDVITLPATGSEMNCGAVISRISTNEKLAFSSEKVYPKFSIIDAETTYSLPTKQTVNGIVDTFVHCMEQYATYDVNTPLQDDWALGIMETLVNEAPKVLDNPTDYEARANIFWCATCGLNYWISLGSVQDWSTHMLGHELTAFYGIDHAQSLSIVLPRLLTNQIEHKRHKLEKLGARLFGVNTADAAIEKIEDFFNSIGMKTKLSDYGISSKEAAQRVMERFANRDVKLGENQIITAEVAFEILSGC